MHCKYLRNISQIVLALSASLVFTGCVVTQTHLPVEPQVTTVEQTEQANAVETFALDEESSIVSAANPLLAEIKDPWQLIEMARKQPPQEANEFMLRAIELFIEQRHYSTAFTMLEQIDAGPLTADQKIYSTLVRARYHLLTGDSAYADTLATQAQNSGTMSPLNFARWLQLDIAIASERGDTQHALLSRLQLDQLLGEGNQNQAALIANQRRILDTLVANYQQFTSSNAIAGDDELIAWLELARLKRDGLFDTQNLANWQQRHPTHPARLSTLNSSVAQSAISSGKIAILLPMTSSLGRAAQAFKAGFDAAIKTDGRFDTSRVYDIGSETELVPFYYQNAVNDGADIIIGPLGRKSVQSMLNYFASNQVPTVPTLVLGELSEEFNHIANLWGFSLSAEQDAKAIAEHAIGQGFHQAIVMQKNNAWGARLNKAFSEAFAAKGGSVVATQRFMPTDIDHTAHVKNLLNINASERRHQRMQSLLGRNLEFSVRRRDDIDFVFLAGSTKDARLILPLIKFYHGHNLPVYATASAHTGKFDRFKDEDLTGLIFAELPWLLNATIQSQTNTQPTATPYSTQSEIKPPYQNATMNRLYALGYAAFETIPSLSSLQANGLSRIEAQTMSLSMDKNRNLLHRVAWGKYSARGISSTP